VQVRRLDPILGKAAVGKAADAHNRRMQDGPNLLSRSSGTLQHLTGPLGTGRHQACLDGRYLYAIPVGCVRPREGHMDDARDSRRMQEGSKLTHEIQRYLQHLT
jgi:hypothetical protein